MSQIVSIRAIYTTNGSQMFSSHTLIFRLLHPSHAREVRGGLGTADVPAIVVVRKKQ